MTQTKIDENSRSLLIEESLQDIYRYRYRSLSPL